MMSPLKSYFSSLDLSPREISVTFSICRIEHFVFTTISHILKKVRGKRKKKILVSYKI